MAQEQLENKVKKTKSKTSENTTPSLKIYNAGSSKFNSYPFTNRFLLIFKLVLPKYYSIP